MVNQEKFVHDFLIWNVITNKFPNWETTLTLISELGNPLPAPVTAPS